MAALIILLSTEKGETLFFLNHYRTSISVMFFRFMSHIVEFPVFVILGFVYLFFSYRTSLLIGIAGLVSLLLAGGMKLFFAQPRPIHYYNELRFTDIVQYLDSYTPLSGYTSFPSGHTTAAFVIFTVLAISFRKPLTDIVFIVLACLSGFSRVFLANHFLEDVFAGSLLGLSVTIIINLILDKYKVPRGKPFLGKRKKIIS